MKPVSIKQIVSATGGELGWGDENATIVGVEIDSREIKKDYLFVPIVGANVDAHKFIPDVIKAGAGCVVSSDRSIECKGGACVFVDDTVDALQKLAAWYRSMFDIPVIGVTGSVGKTSTKEMIGAVLSKKYKTLITKGNLNSQVGLALMMFYLNDEYEIAVFEMGVSLPGEMERLVEISRPQTAVLTNIGVSHIGNMGSRENICREKGHIIKYFPEKGKFFVCGNGDQYDIARKNVPYEICEGSCESLFYGLSEEREDGRNVLSYYAEDIKAGENGMSYTFVSGDGSKTDVSLSVMGEHNVCNSVAAIALGAEFGISADEAAKAVSEYKPLDKRGVLREKDGYTIIDDTYNASPDSIRSNLRALFSYPGASRRIAVLGDVLELGENSHDLHRSVGAFIASEAKAGRRLDYLFIIGREMKAAADYVTEKTDIPVKTFGDNYSLSKELKEELSEGDFCMLKGSRGMHLDEVVSELLK